jgi:2-methylaconitate cis-trans-isomerase PrpF
MPTAASLSSELLSIPATIIRGGTSKGVFLAESDLPADRTLWGPFLIALFGARDATQIDGVGGARPTTSKCCIVGPSSRPDADVDYTFAQVGIGEPKVYWDFNCGNLTPAVGVFAILAGFVKPKPGTTEVSVYQTNTRMILGIEVPTDADGVPVFDGAAQTAGVSGTGAPVLTNFSRTVGASLGGGLFPTGNRSDVLTVPKVGDITCTIVDLANMCVFFRADEAGLDGFEMPDRGPEVVGTYIAVRQAAQRLLGVDPSKTTPWPVSVAKPKPYTMLNGLELAEQDYDFAVRFAGIQPMRDTMHEAYPGTASCCTGVAAVASGTVVNEVYASRGRRDGVVAIGHPSGVMRVGAAVHDDADGRPVVDQATFDRTVRPIMRGEAYVRRSDMGTLTDAIGAGEPTRAGVPSTSGELA